MKILCAFAIGLLFADCAARRACGIIDPDDIAAFHRSHALSVTANESSVEGLALADEGVDGGTAWWICVEAGRAAIQNHPTAQEIEMEWHP